MARLTREGKPGEEDAVLASGERTRKRLNRAMCDTRQGLHGRGCGTFRVDLPVDHGDASGIDEWH